jgi:hypothetical protein
MVTVIATLQKFYNTPKILYKYNHTNYVEKIAASHRVTSYLHLYVWLKYICCVFIDYIYCEFVSNVVLYN